ncbi:MAG: DUF1002 domain-containing protein [Lachnospiraceae bacterium]|nr:DUF1002 domain-containing protein [Candidatus Colinaster scatohippi]
MKKLLINRIISGILSGVVCIFICVAIPRLDIRATEDNSEYYGIIVEIIKEELRNGNLQTKEDAYEAIRKAEKQYGIDISDADEEKIIRLVGLAEDLGVDGEKMADIVEDVYDKVIDGKVYESTDDMIKAVESQVIDSAAEVVKENVVDTLKKSIDDYFNDFMERMRSFWKKLLSIWKI